MCVHVLLSVHVLWHIFWELFLSFYQRGSQRLNSGHSGLVASTFTPWAICQPCVLAKFFCFIFKFGYFICLGILPAYMSVHHVCAWCLQRPDENVFQGSNVCLPTDPSLAHAAFLELLQHDMKAQILQWNAWLSEGRVKGSSRKKKGDWRQTGGQVMYQGSGAFSV